MRLAAYLLAADPAWIEMSVRSYYPLVSSIVVSYDEDSRGWTGEPADVAKCLARLQALDVDGKLIFAPGQYSNPSEPAIRLDTRQRQSALDQAGAHADWVLQVDTDEVLFSRTTFLRCLTNADRIGADALEYPARVFRQRAGPGLYLEECSRFWGLSTSYPGAIAVRSGTRLRLARQVPSGTNLHRVDLRRRSSDHSQPLAPVHEVIDPGEAIMHFSWVRTNDALERKFLSWGHASDRDWSPTLRRWQWAGHHPRLAAAITPFQSRFPLSYLRPRTLAGVDGVGEEESTLRSARSLPACALP